VIPIVFEAVVGLTAAKGNDRIGAVDSPEHSRLLEPGADKGLAGGFDDARADEKALSAEVWISHAVLVFLEVSGLDAKDLLLGGRSVGESRIQVGGQLLDLAGIEFGLMTENPTLL
jgi:hypothetical protein